jgi:hypothetical protein
VNVIPAAALLGKIEIREKSCSPPYIAVGNDRYK